MVSVLSGRKAAKESKKLGKELKEGKLSVKL